MVVHRILITTMELVRFKIKNEWKLVSLDDATLTGTFLFRLCGTSVSFFQETMSWFSTIENVKINLHR